MDQKAVEQAVKQLLIAIGDDPQRPGLVETPQRVAKMYGEIASSLGRQPEDLTNYKVFQVEDTPRMVIVEHIPFYSLCEHHLLPFFGEANVAYVPRDGKVIGLSKIPRLVDFAARRPGMQERVTTDIVKELQRLLNPRGIAVTITARHLCMEMRGINKRGQDTYTSRFTGLFNDDDGLRREFLMKSEHGQVNL
ncbi:MAG: GTP cyclohydrolase I FolE [[Lactobacillus] timonensis]|jgi:GTP cyclohydrolase I|uniref:GTP cyclohydrolase I FolE n=1 Tax=[Lactobacillus] timonensis TaxID=1970790 RepID=UPI002355A8B2|nr:GTP cyclohydrolase I FolE [[Lactobacillus] timonensis]MCI1925720.1 GTP cyclohydrolase I FolE [[Lactobacillus] timonensis]MCI1957081.1 GTP cyclohydrolase I FolE [[Lactobacillus] timonensis]MCI1969964.1 GTP cyclohydrolase I FolE [[Lactobacillus] timonensis]MCI2006271.1 GTP cyclohydrolase I FolE [[Lactobacillus] timonensis]